ncbi:MFS transporter [Listeria sp. PSOL-1]|uniref:MFS transporter n=1 Tax=Listeria sp. PSOL-1 TaxID=1844999 RepID=UPI0013D19140|nr:MFS transporter [Listeria sp. PSOL-1]
MSKSTQQKFGIILPVILFSYFMILFDVSVTFTATVKIATDLNLNEHSLSWVSNAYSLTFGGLLLFSGRAGDIFGRKRMLLIGLFLFSVSSLFVGLSTNAPMIVISRALQGVGSSILAPATLALLMDTYRDDMRSRAIVAYGATIGIGTSFGLVFGGMIASLFTWRDAFFINLPIGGILFILTLKYVKTDRLPSTSKQKLDYRGTIFSIIGFSTLLYSIVGETHQLTFLVIALIFLGAFIITQHYAKAPIMPLKLFLDYERSSSYIARFFFMGGILAYWFLAPQAMQHVFHYSPLQAGISFLPMTVVQFFSATKVTMLKKRFGDTRVLFIGIILTMLGFIIAFIAKIESGYILSMAVPMIFLGVGQGLSLSPMTEMGLANTDPSIAGSASGVVNTIHQFGGALGLSVIVALSSVQMIPAKIYNYSLIFMILFIFIALLAVSNLAYHRHVD